MCSYFSTSPYITCTHLWRVHLRKYDRCPVYVAYGRKWHYGGCTFASIDAACTEGSGTHLWKVHLLHCRVLKHANHFLTTTRVERDREEPGTAMTDAATATHHPNTTVAVPAALAGTFDASFVLPVTRDGFALLTHERRGKDDKYGLLGGKAHNGENSYECAAREAKEESGGALSDVTIKRIARGAGVLACASYDNANAVVVKHDLVHKADLDAHERFDSATVSKLRAASAKLATPIQKKKKSKAHTVQLGLVRVPISDLRDSKWRNAHMHHCPSVLVARLGW